MTDSQQLAKCHNSVLDKSDTMAEIELPVNEYCLEYPITGALVSKFMLT
jgi:hypothetical protein